MGLCKSKFQEKEIRFLSFACTINEVKSILFNKELHKLKIPPVVEITRVIGTAVDQLYPWFRIYVIRLYKEKPISLNSFQDALVRKHFLPALQQVLNNNNRKVCYIQSW